MHHTLTRALPLIALIVLTSSLRSEAASWGYIVTFDADANVDETVEALKQRHRLAVGYVYRHALKGMYVANWRLSPETLGELRHDPRVAQVEPNGFIDVLPDGEHPSGFIGRMLAQFSGTSHRVETSGDEPDPKKEQVLPNGFRRINGHQAYDIDGSDVEVDATIAIIDTGIDPDHEDLNVVDGVAIKSFLFWMWADTAREEWDDVSGHGTSVAGVAAAKDNDIGIVGAAPGAKLIAVRVVDWIVLWLPSHHARVIAGIDWVAERADGIDVANLSLGGWKSETLDAAVRGLVDLGVVVCISSGTMRYLPLQFDAIDWSPMREPSAITVSGLNDTDGEPGGFGKPSRTDTYGDDDDTFGFWSFYGDVVDICAPGADILSTLPQNEYGIASGTSFSCPFVAGAAALWIAERRDESTTPADVLEGLLKDAWREGDEEYFDSSDDPDGTPDPLLNLPSLRVKPLNTKS